MSKPPLRSGFATGVCGVKHTTMKIRSILAITSGIMLGIALGYIGSVPTVFVEFFHMAELMLVPSKWGAIGWIIQGIGVCLILIPATIYFTVLFLMIFDVPIFISPANKKLFPYNKESISPFLLECLACVATAFFVATQGVSLPEIQPLNTFPPLEFNLGSGYIIGIITVHTAIACWRSTFLRATHPNA